MARATKEQSEVTARRILDTATRMFAADGFAAAGLAEVAEAAEVTRGAVYHHFASKKGLFEAVAAAAQQRVADAVVAAADGSPDAWTGLLAGCHAFLVASVADHNRRIVLVDAPATLGWNTWREQDADASGRHLSEALRELAAAGLIEVRSAGGAAALLSGAMNEAALRIAAAPNREVELEIIWSDLRRMLHSLRS